MKRKLDQDDLPTLVALSSKSQTEPSFKAFGLDPRLLQATIQEGFTAPTSVQAKVVPLALEGKDILGDQP